MAWRPGIRWRVTAASAVALVLAAVALAVALVAASHIRAQGHVLSRRLVPAAAAAGDLLDDYQAQQTWLRGYVTDGSGGTLALLNEVSATVRNVQDQLRRLAGGDQPIIAQLDATVTAGQAWLADVADPQLRAMQYGFSSTAQALQNDTGQVRPYVLAIRSAGAALQAQITNAQRAATDKLNSAQGALLAALTGLCVVVAALVVNCIGVLWLGLLRPFRALRLAVGAVTAGDYDSRIPAAGPPELASLGRAMELMRLRLVAALTEREQAEQRFRRMFDTAPDAMIAVAADGSIAMANTQAVRLFGYPAPDLIGRPVEMLVSEEARAPLAAGREDYFAGPLGQPLDTELKLPGLRRDGRRFPAEITLSGLPMEHGTLVTAAIRDATERLAAEAERERLRAVAEQERVDRRLAQSQRLESLGQLVGGVAHDFNNLLNVISGYADFTAEQVQPLAVADSRLEPVLDDIEQVRVAAQQATRLTRQLLTFARHEVVRPEVLDLNAAVAEAGQLLRRTLGEHVDLGITPEPALWRVKADRGQLEQVLVNLAVNARDAMPEGGRLTIETANTYLDDAYAIAQTEVIPGQYVMIAVSDTGSGMTKEVAARAFEPFFTTKESGQGTGLGLSQVYGFVKQSGGTINIYSQPGVGTTVRFCFPAVRNDMFAEANDDHLFQYYQGTEKTLVVDDRLDVADIAQVMLKNLGYKVRVAHSAQ